MKITRFGHSCLLVETGKANLLLDPGVFSSIPETLPKLDAILISHEHQDHAEPTLIKKLLADNEGAPVYTNAGVGKMLTEHDIMFSEVTEGQTLDINGAAVEIFGRDHAIIYPTIPAVLNSAFFVDNAFFFPGDSFFVPNKSVKMLALPVGGPWMKVAEAIDYAMTVKAENSFPIHEAMYKNIDMAHAWCQMILKPAGVSFTELQVGASIEI